ncbi:MAG: sugar phosphate isomerase/epimerase [Clostridia bacterium]|nr:sugar phosphate isomerase/epimerase [Clostridia bacterium]
MSKVEYGLQMYSLRDITKDDLRGALKGAAELGYKYVEFAGFFGHPAEDVKAWLDEYGLICCSTHTGMPAIAPEALDDTIAYHKAIGCNYLIVPGCAFSTKAEADASIATMVAAQKKLAENGIGMAYHNHSREFFPNADGMIFEDEILNRTTLDIQIDTFWSFNADVDTIPYLEAHKDRIKTVHLKDGFPSAADCKNFAHCHDGVKGMAVGEGKNDVRAVREWAIKNGVRMVIESEGCVPTGLEEVGRCISYLRSLD